MDLQVVMIDCAIWQLLDGVTIGTNLDLLASGAKARTLGQDKGCESLSLSHC